jgi:hypothetical protein
MTVINLFFNSFRIECNKNCNITFLLSNNKSLLTKYNSNLT